METITAYLEDHTYVRHLAVLVGALATGLLSYVVTRAVFLRGAAFVAQKTRFRWDDVIISKGALNKVAYIAPAVVFYYFGYLFENAGPVLQRLLQAAILGLLLLAINDLLDAANAIYNTYEFSKDRPIKGYLQVLKIVLFLFGGITVLALVLDQSPMVFISGLGAMTAVILLIFKDTILSLVASIQIATNDMVRIGDWISMPRFDADGDVVDIALHTVKVQNWDKTITTIPTHKFIEDSFTNWRGMSESGGRRIKRSVSIDQTSVRFLDDALIERLSKIQLLQDYLQDRQTDIARHNAEHEVDTSDPINGRRMTNLGTFREYLLRYLKAHPDLHSDMTLLVRQLAPTSTGVPMEVYCFSKDQRWAHYESIQGDIFDHVLASLPAFDLEVFQAPTGKDVKSVGPGAAAAVASGPPSVAE